MIEKIQCFHVDDNIDVEQLKYTFDPIFSTIESSYFPPLILFDSKSYQQYSGIFNWPYWQTQVVKPCLLDHTNQLSRFAVRKFDWNQYKVNSVFYLSSSSIDQEIELDKKIKKKQQHHYYYRNYHKKKSFNTREPNRNRTWKVSPSSA